MSNREVFYTTFLKQIQDEYADMARRSQLFMTLSIGGFAALVSTLNGPPDRDLLGGARPSELRRTRAQLGLVLDA